MRGEYESTGKMFSYVSTERRIPADPLRPMRALVHEALKRRWGGRRLRRRSCCGLC